jgi:hypothetical protein
MADSTTAKKPVDSTNWAEMDHEEEEDDQEIGIQQKGATQEGGAGAEENKETTGDAAGEGQTEGGDGAGKDGKYPPRKRKDYGDKYDPNYKKGPWRKNIKPQEEHKRIVVP